MHSNLIFGWLEEDESKVEERVGEDDQNILQINIYSINIFHSPSLSPSPSIPWLLKSGFHGSD